MPMRGRRTREREDEKRMRMTLLRCGGVGERKLKGNPSRTNGRETEWAVAATGRGRAERAEQIDGRGSKMFKNGRSEIENRKWKIGNGSLPAMKTVACLEGRPACEEDNGATWRGGLLATKTMTLPGGDACLRRRRRRHPVACDDGATDNERERLRRG
ncbi:hypothetical protein ACLOJK_027968 [Asimina triloba]